MGLAVMVELRVRRATPATPAHRAVHLVAVLVGHQVVATPAARVVVAIHPLTAQMETRERVGLWATPATQERLALQATQAQTEMRVLVLHRVVQVHPATRVQMATREQLEMRELVQQQEARATPATRVRRATPAHRVQQAQGQREATRATPALLAIREAHPQLLARKMRQVLSHLEPQFLILWELVALAVQLRFLGLDNKGFYDLRIHI
jgi:xanthosine utilization system XapX-like protein